MQGSVCQGYLTVSDAFEGFQRAVARLVLASVAA